MYFKTLPPNVVIDLSFNINGSWTPRQRCMVGSNRNVVSMMPVGSLISNANSIPCRIDVLHEGCQYQLETSYVEGELNREYA